MTGKTDKRAEALFRTVRDYYGSTQSLAHYSDSARNGGLYPPERAMVERFMAAPATVLDVGCGAGREAFDLTRMGFSVTGVDITPSLVNKAKGTAADLGLNVQFCLGNGRSLDFPDESFDYVLLITQMIHHVPHKTNRQRLLGEARRVLKAEGTILLTYHDWDIEKDHLPWGWKNGKHCGAPPPEELPETLKPLESGDSFTRDCQGTLTDTFGFVHHFTRREMEEEVVKARLKIEDRAAFETVAGGEPDEFWNPTQILVLKCAGRLNAHAEPAHAADPP